MRAVRKRYIAEMAEFRQSLLCERGADRSGNTILYRLFRCIAHPIAYEPRCTFSRRGIRIYVVSTTSRDRAAKPRSVEKISTWSPTQPGGIIRLIVLGLW